MQSAKSQAPAPTTSSPAQANNQQLPTFLDHVYELRRRLFWVVAAVLVASSVAYSFLGAILDVLTMPLGDERLFYLTPGGGLSFSFKLCAYVGFIAAVPIIMYHLYRFLEPLMGHWRRPTIFYVGLSTLLAASGILFAYFISLPAAIRFLTGFSVNHIQAMLTADSYLSFVATYLLGAALLFQIPLLLLIINTMTPLKPSKLMKLQKFVVVGAFILGAIISPTPDIMNQTFLALPVIAMYQLGVLLVWLQNRARARKQTKAERAAMQSKLPVATPMPMRRPTLAAAPLMADTIPDALLQELAQPRQAAQPVMVQSKHVSQPMINPQQAYVKPAPATQRRVFNDIAPRQQPTAQHTTHHPSQAAPAQRTAIGQPRTAAPLQVPQRSVDGFTAYRPIRASGMS